MTVIKVGAENAEDYVDYAQKYGRDHDESYLPSAGFLPDDEHPAFLLIDEASNLTPGKVIGAAGLILTPAYREAGRSRITIFHWCEGGKEACRLLNETILRAAHGVDSVYGFLPVDCRETSSAWRDAGWKEERRSYLLLNDNPSVPDDTAPEGYTWSWTGTDNDEKLEKWRNLVNNNFSSLPGHVELTLERTREMAQSDDNLGNGLSLLNGPGGPVGTLQAEIDEDEDCGSFIGAICLKPELRGRGLGRLILRRGVALSRRAGLNPTWLSVSAENENAVELYLSEGFRNEKVLVCYGMAIPS